MPRPFVCSRHVAIIVSALLPLAARAQTLPERLLGCAAVADSGQRLACFDGLVAEQSRSVPAAEPSAAPILAPEEKFGREQQLVYQSTTGDDALQQVTARIVGLRERSDGRLTVELDNGQVWAQSEVASSPVPLTIGETVTIRRGAVGSFVLVTKHSRSFRVRRTR
jgi:hypothetical protein